MSQRTLLHLFLANKEASLTQIYDAFPQFKKHSIRGRLNEAIDKYFRRVSDGVYTAILGKYQVIYADPAWTYANSASRGSAATQYDLMDLQRIKALPVSDLCQKDAMLFLWATPPLLKEALEVMESWGFSYKTIAFVWVKLNKDGTPFMGLGNYTRANAELCLLGVRKQGVKVIKHDISQIIQSVREIHSKKPHIVYKHIEQLHGNVTRLELFAREFREGWDAWGNQLPVEKQKLLQ